MKWPLVLALAGAALVQTRCAPNCGDANGGQGGCLGRDGQCYVCLGSNATLWDGKNTSATQLQCTTDTRGMTGCGATNSQNVTCCAVQGGGGSMSCNPGYCLSNGACCPSSTPHYCQGSCYDTLPPACTTEKWGGCF